MAENVLKSVVEVWAPRGAQLGRLRQHGDSVWYTAKVVGPLAWAPPAGFQPQKTLFDEKVIPVSARITGSRWGWALRPPSPRIILERDFVPLSSARSRRIIPARAWAPVSNICNTIRCKREPR